MSDLKMGTAEARFADIIWEKESIISSELALEYKNTQDKRKHNIRKKVGHEKRKAEKLLQRNNFSAFIIKSYYSHSSGQGCFCLP